MNDKQPQLLDARIDPQCRELIEMDLFVGDFVDGTLSVQRARQLDVELAWLGGEPLDVHRVTHIEIPGPAPLPAIVYQPEASASDGVLVWFHGGGWVTGTPQRADTQARAIARASGCTVVSATYRRAPEHPYPIPLHDAYRATQWVANHLKGLAPGAQFLAIGGDSAGGNLAASVSLLSPQLDGPQLDFQALLYPSLTGTRPTESKRQFGEGFGLTTRAVEWLLDQYAGSSANQPFVAPVEAESLVGTPPTYILMAELDPLCDDGHLYADALQRVGISAETRIYPGMLHGFAAHGAVVKTAWAALDELGRAIHTAMATQPT